MGFTTNVLTLMLVQILGFAASFFSGLFVIRFLLQWARAPFRNPIGRFVMTLTDWGVLRLRRVVPGWRGNDLSSLVMAWLIETVVVIVALLLIDTPAGLGGNLLPLAFIAGFVEMLRMICYVILAAAIGVVVLSWVNPHAPMAPVLQSVAEPFLRPFQRVIPPIAGIDLSPLFLLLVLQVVLGALAFAKSGILGIHL